MWHQDAKCADDDLTRYILDGGPGRVDAQLRPGVAARLCAGCPVKSECLSEARTYGDVGVVRGGTWLTYSAATRPLPVSA